MDDTKNAKTLKRDGGNRIRRKSPRSDRLDALLKSIKESCSRGTDFWELRDQAESLCRSPRDFLCVRRAILEGDRKFVTTNRALQRLEKKDPGCTTKWLRWAEKNLDHAEALLRRIPHGKNDFDDPVYRDYFDELCYHSDTLWLVAKISPRAAIGADTVKRQRKANEARNKAKDGTVTKIIKGLAKRQDFNPSELWNEFFGDLDLHDLEPAPGWDAEKDEEVVNFIGGKMGYGAFRKRIIRYRK